MDLVSIELYFIQQFLELVLEYGALIGALIGSISPTLIGISLSFAAGAMLYIVSCEIVPESNSIYRGRKSTIRKYNRFYFGIKYNINLYNKKAINKFFIIYIAFLFKYFHN